MSNTIDTYRKQIDEIDNLIATLFNDRMALCERIGIEKKKGSTSVLVKGREEEILSRVTKLVDSKFESSTTKLFETVFEISRNLQEKLWKKLL